MGLILEEYKFNVSARGNKGFYTEFWFDYPSGAESTAKPSYPHLLKWSEKMQDTVRRYNAQYLKTIGVFEEIEKAKGRHEKAAGFEPLGVNIGSNFDAQPLGLLFRNLK